MCLTCLCWPSSYWITFGCRKSLVVSHISGLVSLKVLYLHRNVLHAMPNISYLKKLEYINLSENDITDVPASTINGILNLLTLILNDNKISVLGDIPALWAHLHLQNNNLRTLPDLYNIKLETLMLRGNPLCCNQSLCWLRMWPWNKTLPTLDEAYCTTPSDFSELRAMQVHPTELQCFNGMTTKIVKNMFMHDGGITTVINCEQFSRKLGTEVILNTYAW